MALVKNSAAITQLTATGNSTTITTTAVAGIGIVVALHHSNGSGTVSAAATAQVQYQLNGAARWYSAPTRLVSFSTTTGSTDDRDVVVPAAATAVRIAYTAPVGATGYALDAEVGSVTP